MANEIRITDRHIARKGITDGSFPPISDSFDWEGEHYHSIVLDVDASETEIEVPLEILEIGWCRFHNVSATARIELSTGTGITFDAHVYRTLRPGEYDKGPSGQNPVYAKCVSAEYYGTDGKLAVHILER